VQRRHALCVVSALRLVEHDQVAGRDRSSGATVVLDVVLDGLHERPARAAAVLQRVLQYLHERTVAREIHGGRRRTAVRALYR
jgi:hypothetical protein